MKILSILYHLFLKLLLSPKKLLLVLLTLGASAALIILAACASRYTPPERFTEPAQVLVIKCDDKALVV